MICRRCKDPTCFGCVTEVDCVGCEQPVSIDHTDVRLSWPLVHPETRQTLSRGTLVCATCYLACRMRGAA